MSRGVLALLVCGALTAGTSARAAPPDVALGLEIVAIKGGVSRAIVLADLRRHTRALQACGRRRLQPGLRISAVVQLFTKAGKTVRIQLLRSSGHPTLDRCLLDVVGRATVAPRTQVGLLITVRLTLAHRTAAQLLAAKVRRLKGPGHKDPASAPRHWEGHTSRQREREVRRRMRQEALAKALVLPRPRARPAPWLAPVLDSYDDQWFPWSRKTTAIGVDTAIVAVGIRFRPEGQAPQGRTLHFGVHRRKGVIGQLAPPAGAVWLGLDGEDAVYAAEPDGQLHRAPSVEAATRPGGFAAVGRVPGALRWDSAGRLVAAITAKAVHLSSDGGRTFKRARPPVANDLARLAVRFDGVVVVQTETRPRAETLVSDDNGRSWRRTAFQPDTLFRAGGWIYADTGCDHAVLAADKRTWVKHDLPEGIGTHPWDTPDGRDRASGKPVGWETLLDAGPRPLAYATGAHPSAVKPPPPRDGAPLTGRPRPCAGGLGLRGTGSDVPGGCGDKQRYRGFAAQCVRGSIGRAPRVSTLWVGWFADGMTDPGRPPTPVLVDHRRGTVTRASLPADCRTPALIRSVAGTAVLVCPLAQGTKSQLHLADASGRWHAEGILDVRPDRLDWFSAADDGTLLAQACHFSAERRRKEGSGYLCSTAFVRRPLPLGSPRAWRETLATDALTYRPLVGGRVLVLDRVDPNRNDRLQLLIDDGHRLRTVARNVTFTQDLQNIYVEQGRVIFSSTTDFVLGREQRVEPLPR